MRVPAGSILLGGNYVSGCCSDKQCFLLIHFALSGKLFLFSATTIYFNDRKSSIIHIMYQIFSVDTNIVYVCIFTKCLIEFLPLRNLKYHIEKRNRKYSTCRHIYPLTHWGFYVVWQSLKDGIYNHDKSLAS